MKRCFVLLIAAFAFTAVDQSAHAAVFKAGAGKADIQISSEMLPVEGYTGQHDAISTRVLLLDEDKTRIALLVVDTPSVQDALVAHWKAILSKVTGVTAENTLVIASHDTSAPHISFGEAIRSNSTAGAVKTNDPSSGQPSGQGQRRQQTPEEIAHAKSYADAVDASVQAAAEKAVATLQPAKIGYGRGTSRINVYRNVRTPKGWTIGYDDSGFTDPSLALIRLESTDGKPLAWLMNYAVRPAVMEQSTTAQGGKLISGDLIGKAERYLESESGSDAVAMFVMGAAVDQSPYLMSNRFVIDKDGNSSRVDIHEAGFYLVDLLGERLGSDAVRVNAGVMSEVPKGLHLTRERVDVASQSSGHEISPGGGAAENPLPVPFSILRIGDIVLVGVVPELNADIGTQIKAESPFPQTVVVTMVDGSAKYLPDVTNYDRKTPEAVGSRFARGSAEHVVEKIEAVLKAQQNDVP
ncbi:hypothetical protein [Silvibacterium dinghuense]|uniref:Neutral/alkaline non-lysosomal ceramidase N-terminal domain-containing protein n=1 Tax=Silvibacterium dinghuense TaxID=1560006 RepID=A0A4Q1S822_9BACT|nr:hypothetical protein [Silvibacterium dinghuense]RXS93003.1 hypothetical protein ESZ00_19395 [Silvibacterium dinghuense]GGG90254.1 hypothetical protein GCM10011586_00840 [Silvibacterium dinghuense]